MGTVGAATAPASEAPSSARLQPSTAIDSAAAVSAHTALPPHRDRRSDQRIPESAGSRPGEIRLLSAMARSTGPLGPWRSAIPKTPTPTGTFAVERTRWSILSTASTRTARFSTPVEDRGPSRPSLDRPFH